MPPRAGQPAPPPGTPPRMRTVTEFAGLTPGYVKPAPVAWFASHRHATDGSNDPYAYSYLFAYAIDIPAGATTLDAAGERADQGDGGDGVGRGGCGPRRGRSVCATCRLWLALALRPSRQSRAPAAARGRAEAEVGQAVRADARSGRTRRPPRPP